MPLSPRPAHRAAAALAALSFVLASCSDGSTTAGSSSSTAGGGGSNRTQARDGGGSAAKGCAEPSRPPSMQAEAKQLAAATGDQPRVLAAVYPHPDYQGKLWSQWGQGVALPDGRFFSAVGDHCGVNGNAYFYEFSPDTGRLRLLGDVISAVGHEAGAWGYGKVHAQLGVGPDGMVYAATYWGASKGITYGNGYEGDLLLRIDPDSGAITKLGIPVARHGIPSMTTWTAGGLLYGEAPDPLANDDAAAADGADKKAKRKARDAAEAAGEAESSDDAKIKPGSFFVYDIDDGKVVFTDDGTHAGYRNVAVGPKGVAYFSGGGGRLKRYDPATRTLGTLPAKLPGAYMRASTRPGPDGTIYGVTREPDTFFALRADGTIDALGAARGYTASMALAPDGDAFYYVPGAHGASWQQGTPLIRVDTETGAQRVVVRLNDLAVDQLGLRLGGSYDVAVDRSGDRVYIGFNAGPTDSTESFGSVVLVVVDLP